MLSACSHTEEPRLEPLGAEEITGERLWRRITQESDYTQYAYWPGHEGERPGQSPHGRFHKIYINRTLRESLPVADRTAPAGAVIVKLNLNERHEEGRLAVMAKVQGYYPEYGDWFWALYEPDGTVVREGTVSGCVMCHEGMKDNDYVIVRDLDREIAP
jgi:hypothetical protein